MGYYSKLETPLDKAYAAFKAISTPPQSTGPHAHHESQKPFLHKTVNEEDFQKALEKYAAWHPNECTFAEAEAKDAGPCATIFTEDGKTPLFSFKLPRMMDEEETAHLWRLAAFFHKGKLTKNALIHGQLQFMGVQE